MGDLVSLCERRRNMERERQAKEREEIEELKELVDAWIEFIGKPVQEPFRISLEDQLRVEDWLDANLTEE